MASKEEARLRVERREERGRRELAVFSCFFQFDVTLGQRKKVLLWVAAAALSGLLLMCNERDVLKKGEYTREVRLWCSLALGLADIRVLRPGGRGGLAIIRVLH